MLSTLFYTWTVFLLSLPRSHARATEKQVERDVADGNALVERLNPFNPFIKRQDFSSSSTSTAPCVYDGYIRWLQSNTIGPEFCAEFMTSSTATQTIYTTPTTSVMQHPWYRPI